MCSVPCWMTGDSLWGWEDHHSEGGISAVSGAQGFLKAGEAGHEQV